MAVTEAEKATAPQHSLAEAAAGADGEQEIVQCTSARRKSVTGEIEELKEEEEEVSKMFEISRVMTPVGQEVEGGVFSFDVNGGEDNVYVAVGKDEASVDALTWTLRRAVGDATSFIYLIHVFPVVRSVPTPLGKLPKSQVSPDQLENYMAQERGKRRELLQKFISICSEYKVKVDTMLIESDSVGKAIQELIPVLHIRKLVLGTSRSISRKSKSWRSGSGIADQILQHAPEYCDVKVISEGKEVDTQIIINLSPPRTSNSSNNGATPTHGNDDGDEPDTIFANGRGGDNQKAGSITCGCFKL
uniref:Uncharacterized protein n=1 Tax=Kalanchoe fedtschenkoi TaxID=63787 RepID=A0A7N1A2Q1_KALFE